MTTSDELALDKATTLQKRLHAVNAMASRFQLAERSDPFIYNRTVTHLLKGVSTLSNYKCEFKSEYRVTHTGEKYSIQIPCNMARGA